MKVNNPPKFIGIIIVIVGLFLLVAIGRVAWADVLPIVTLITGYLIGNGVAARGGEPVSPALGRKDPK